MAWPTEISEFRPQESLKATISGLGAVEARLGSVLTGHGARRPMVVCGSNVVRSPAFDKVVGALDTKPVVFDGVRPHTPVEAVQEGAAMSRARAHRRVGGCRGK